MEALVATDIRSASSFTYSYNRLSICYGSLYPSLWYDIIFILAAIRHFFLQVIIDCRTLIFVESNAITWHNTLSYRIRYLPHILPILRYIFMFIKRDKNRYLKHVQAAIYLETCKYLERYRWPGISFDTNV